MSRIKRTIISGKARANTVRGLETLVEILDCRSKVIHDPVCYTATFTHECKSKDEAKFLLERTAWGLAGNREEIKIYLKEIREEGKLTFDGATIQISQFMGDK